MTSRRAFLQQSSLLGFGATVPAFLGRTALAAPPAGKPGAKDTVLVVVQLTGGNDGLNTVIPYKNDEYYKLRPNIAVPKDQVKGIGQDLGFHPAFDGMYSGTRHERNGSWCPHMMLILSAGTPLEVSSVSTGTPSPP